MTQISIPSVFREQVAKLRSRPMVYSRRDRHWRPLTWLQIQDRVDSAAAGLCRLGIMPQDRVAIIGQSSVEWVIADLAILSAGAVTVAISETAALDDILWTLGDSGAKAVFIGEPELLRQINSRISKLSSLEHVLAFHGAVRCLDELDVSSFSLLRLENLGREEGKPGEVDTRVEGIDPSEIMTLIYTSGTTGQPKGVMISHDNMVANCQACLRAIPINPDDVLLSFLPLSHSFERMAGYYMPALFGGATIYYSEGIDRLLDDIGEVRPTLMTGVPRIYEKIYGNILRLRAEANPAQKLAANVALSVGARFVRRQESGRPPGKLLNWQYKWLRDRVFQGLRKRLGGRLRLFVSGGAPLAREIAEFFYSSGLLILEGYGLTETSPVVSVNRPDAFRFGTVGKPLSNVRVRIAEDGEILVKAPSVMMGYWNQPDGTQSVVSDDGWLSTGDIGLLDRDGFLRITDRKKDLFKDSGGRYIAPQRVEGLLRLEPFIAQACLVGDNRPFCVALIVPELAALEAWAKTKKIYAQDTFELLRNPAVVRLIQKSVNRVNNRLSRHETILGFQLLERPFTTGEALLTPSLKVRRTRVQTRYLDEIDALYSSIDRSRQKRRKTKNKLAE